MFLPPDDESEQKMRGLFPSKVPFRVYSLCLQRRRRTFQHTRRALLVRLGLGLPPAGAAAAPTTEEAH